MRKVLEILENLPYQLLKMVLAHSYLPVPQAAGQVKNLLFQVKIKFSPIYDNTFCDAGQMPI